MKALLYKIKTFLMRGFAVYFNIILIFSVLFILIVGYYWILRPEFESIEQESDLSYITSYQNYLQNYLDKMQSLRVTRNKLDKEFKDKIQNLLPSEEDFSGLFVQLQALAEKNGFMLESVDIAKDQDLAELAEAKKPKNEDDEQAAKLPDLDSIKKLDVSINISGNNYEALKNFLTDIEYNLRLFDVYSINFGSVDGGPYAIVLNTYYLPE